MATQPLNLAGMSAEGLRNYLRTVREDVGDAVDLSDKALKGLTTAQLYELASQVPTLTAKQVQQKSIYSLAEQLDDNKTALQTAQKLYEESGLASEESIASKAREKAVAALSQSLASASDPVTKYILKEIDKDYGEPTPDGKARQVPPDKFLAALNVYKGARGDKPVATGIMPDTLAATAANFLNLIERTAQTQYVPALTNQSIFLGKEIASKFQTDQGLREAARKQGLSTKDLESALLYGKPEFNTPATGEAVPQDVPSDEEGYAILERKDGSKVTIPASVLDDQDRVLRILRGEDVFPAEDAGATAEPAVDFSTFEADPYADVGNVDFSSPLLEEPARINFSDLPDSAAASDSAATAVEPPVLAPVESYDEAAARRLPFFDPATSGEVNRARFVDTFIEPLLTAFSPNYTDAPEGADPENPRSAMVEKPESLLRRAERFPEGSADRAMLQSRARSISSALDVALKKALAPYQ
jgi:hypothetical protein